MAAKKKKASAKKKKLTFKASPVKELRLTGAQKKETRDLVVTKLSTLKSLGIDKKTIDALLETDAIRHHKSLTCGDYNL